MTYVEICCRQLSGEIGQVRGRGVGSPPAFEVGYLAGLATNACIAIEGRIPQRLHTTLQALLDTYANKQGWMYPASVHDVPTLVAMYALMWDGLMEGSIKAEYAVDPAFDRYLRYVTRIVSTGELPFRCSPIEADGVLFALMPDGAFDARGRSGYRVAESELARKGLLKRSDWFLRCGARIPDGILAPDIPLKEDIRSTFKQICDSFEQVAKGIGC
ncbi:MAG: hypothetical protein AB7K09_16645 [Planctomycetota bacterium]